MKGPLPTLELPPLPILISIHIWPWRLLALYHLTLPFHSQLLISYTRPAPSSLLSPFSPCFKPIYLNRAEFLTAPPSSERSSAQLQHNRVEFSPTPLENSFPLCGGWLRERSSSQLHTQLSKEIGEKGFKRGSGSGVLQNSALFLQVFTWFLLSTIERQRCPPQLRYLAPQIYPQPSLFCWSFIELRSLLENLMSINEFIITFY